MKNKLFRAKAVLVGLACAGIPLVTAATCDPYGGGSFYRDDDSDYYYDDGYYYDGPYYYDPYCDPYYCYKSRSQTD